MTQNFPDKVVVRILFLKRNFK